MMVPQKMTYPEKVVLHKGCFPDTIASIIECFCFVRIDTDLYTLTVAALKCFCLRIFSYRYIFVGRGADRHLQGNQGMETRIDG